MPKADILFIQGAGEGAHAEDELLKKQIEQAFPAKTVAYPFVAGLEEVDWNKAKPVLSAALDDLVEGGIVVTHSLGGAALLKLLAEGGTAARPRAVFLAGTPYKLVDGEFGKDDFALPLDLASRLPAVPLTFFHSRDDEFVGFGNMAQYREKLPGATFREVDGFGHQFSGKPFDELMRDIRSAM